MSCEEIGNEEGEFGELICKVSEGLRNHAPEMCEEGLNGTYFLRDKDGEMVAVFKPQDEEGNSTNNPKKSTPSDFSNRGIQDGEGAQREVAAYLLDKEVGFAGVPKTTMVKIAHPLFGSTEDGQAKIKIGSLQEFICNEGASWDMGFTVFPVHEVHKIGIFDLRIFNNDRHGGNMLITMGDNDTYKLTPIDHGFSLSSNLSHAWFDWLTWPQAQKPFSQEAKDYIAAIDTNKDTQTLMKLQIRPECLMTMKISTMVLQKGASVGMTLYDLGTMVSRADQEKPSELEIIYERALKEMGIVDGEIRNEKEEKQLLETISYILDNKMAKMKNPPVHTVSVN